MKRLLVFLLLIACAAAGSAATFPSGRPSTTSNDDSCDIAVLPAATLLLPYFEVDTQSPITAAKTTLFTIVNTVQSPQIARVTVWTDLGYPVLDFNIFLTGYDVQAVNLYDVVMRGIVPATSNATTPGSRSLLNTTGNPNFFGNAAQGCGNILGGPIPPSLQQSILTALTRGASGQCGEGTVGGAHPGVATGYITIDTVATCSTVLPTQPEYYQELLFDNVLTGDYQYVNPNVATGNYAGGNPLVHIRAIPEGGPAGAGSTTTDLPYTFYDRFTPAQARQIDRRQPLPSTFAARFIQGGPTAFQTEFNIWREGLNAATSACATIAQNANMRIAEVVRFDERENPTEFVPSPLQDPPLPFAIELPATSKTATSANIFPPLSASGDLGGWMYLNLNNEGSSAYSVAEGVDLRTNSSSVNGLRQSQNWVAVSMYSEGRYSTLTDATMLANGCTRAPASPDASTPGATVPPIGPGPND